MTSPNGIGVLREDNRNRSSRSSCRFHLRRCRGDDHLDGHLHQLVGEPRKLVHRSGPAELDHEGLALDISEIPEACAQCGDLAIPAGRRTKTEESDAMDPCLLSESTERGNERA